MARGVGLNMSRKPVKKEIVNSRLLKEYASWIYCDCCNKTVAYLCYVTYDFFDFEYMCSCQSSGHVYIEFENNTEPEKSGEALVEIKNRLCCCKDNSPLVSVVAKNLREYRLSVVCNKCNTRFFANG